MFLFLLQMLKYVGNSGTNEQQNAAKDMIVPLNGSPTSGDLITQIVITDTEVQHSGTYKCEPGDAPAAKVQVHVLDGETIINLYSLYITPPFHFVLHSLHTSCRFQLICALSFFSGKLPAAMQTAGVGTQLHIGLFLLVAVHGAVCIQRLLR